MTKSSARNRHAGALPSGGVQRGTDQELWRRAGELCAALVAGDLEALRRLCDAEFWDRAGAGELPRLAEHTTAATPLGVLGRRTLSLVITPSAEHAEYAVEQQWAAGPPGLVVEDERLFTLLDRGALLAAGDEERLARMATKLAAQEAALAYVAALEARDSAAVAGMWSPAFDSAHGDQVRARIPLVIRAALVGSVGPRTLVRCRFSDGVDETDELLWRQSDGRWLVHGARSFRPPEPATRVGGVQA
jgi:hypothetical protein